MPRLDLTGLDELLKAFDNISKVPDGVKTKALKEMADLAATKIKASGESYGVRDPESNVHILDNIKTGKPRITDSGGYVDVSIAGTRTRSNKTIRNAEIAFINEYGKRNQPARPFMDDAMKRNSEAIVRTGADIIGEWIENNFEK